MNHDISHRADRSVRCTFDLPQAVMNLSPYGHTPRLPGGDFSATPVIWLTAIAAALTVAGLASFRRRDVG